MANHPLAKYFPQIQDLLSRFSDEEVISLATTITRGLLKKKISGKQDAVKAIINYSEDVTSILRRKFFTRERLLSYLYEQNIPIKLPVTKPEIIKEVLKLWKINSENHDNENNSSVTDFDDYSSEDSTTPLNNEYQETESSGPQIVSTLQSDEVAKRDSDDVQNIVITLAEQFCQWFYKLLNENQLTSEHFFPDALLNLTLVSNGESNSKCVSKDPEAITNSLLSTKTQHDLFFNPNLSKEGIKGQMDPHGLVMVIVCGTLHSKNICVGVFEQMFALARDPFAENNWKIKRTDVRLKSSNNVTTPPKVCDINITNSTNTLM